MREGVGGLRLSEVGATGGTRGQGAMNRAPTGLGLGSANLPLGAGQEGEGAVLVGGAVFANEEDVRHDLGGAARDGCAPAAP